MWMLKFPAQGDPDDLAGIEAAALSLARACGIETPEHRTVQIGAGTPKSGLMIERFDRRRVDGGFAPYASAYTVMDLDTGSEGPERRSYLNFAHEALRWCASGTDRRHGDAQRREIWRRIVFNALVNNNDDHPRNHALIKDGPLWRLSPIFDVVPVGQHQAQRVLSMAFRREREFANVASRENLLACSRLYGWRQQEAEQELQRMALIVNHDWEAMMLRHGTTRRSIGQRASAFGLAMEIAAAA